MLSRSYVLAAVLYCLLGPGISAQTVPDFPKGSDQPVAVSISEITNYGVTTHDARSCDSTGPVEVYSDPNLTNKIGTIPSHSFVRYFRLSELVHRSPLQLGKEFDMSSGEPFRVFHDSITGWVHSANLMTFGSMNKWERFDRKIVQTWSTLFSLVASGQYESAGCSMLCAWENERKLDVWVLSSTIPEPIPVGLYTFPYFDTLVEYGPGSNIGRGNVALLLSAISGDGGDTWNSYSYYLYEDKQLRPVLARDNYTMAYVDGKTLECDLLKDAEGRPIARIVECSYTLDDPQEQGLPRNFTGCDTTIVDLLAESAKQ